MIDLDQVLTELGITGKRYRNGGRNFKTLCPQCSHTRKNKSDPCLSVRVDETGVGIRCHNCGWTEGRLNDGFKRTAHSVFGDKESPKRRDVYGDLLRSARSGWASRS